MGYTHYIRQYRDLTDEEWATFTDCARIIFETSSVPLASWDGTGEPMISDDRVSFNGVGSDGCETCAINRTMRELFDYEVKSGETSVFDFCKTRRRPYDVIVRSIYRLAFDVAPDAFSLSSDGGDSVFDMLSFAHG
jgi:hypothetical protein